MTAKIDSNKLIEMSTNMIFDRVMAIYLTRRAFGPGKVWNVTNEIGEYLNKDLEFEHAAGQRGTREFKMRTDFDFNTAYQMAGAYVGKTIRERKELNQADFPIRDPGSSPNNKASQQLED